MCGIAGFVDVRLLGNNSGILARANAMGDAIRHRGPDGDGYFAEPEVGLGLAHRRLSIIDLSPGGAQPMTSSDGRFVICYNGEVYNANELRGDSKLRSVCWRGHSDTEVILEFAAVHGIELTLNQINGMFAIALWDRRDRVLHLARDRVGIKPLFVAENSTSLSFASELKSLRVVEDFRSEVDPQSVASFLRFGYVPGPYSIFRDTTKLFPGEHVAIDCAVPHRGLQIRRRKYWSLAEAARKGADRRADLSDSEAIDQLELLLRDAVSQQMLSDVPLGAFLSGGVDSSTVVAMMVAAKKGPVYTFSIGFEEGGFDEAAHAAAVAAHLGTVHTELKIVPQDALDVVPLLSNIYDEPFADSSQIPTFLVSKLTRQHVTVALSGDGGDELFAGYNRYRVTEGLLDKLTGAPLPMRRVASKVLGAIPKGAVEGMAMLLPLRLRPNQAGDKLSKLAQILPLTSGELYQRLVSQIPDPKLLAPNILEHDVLNWEAADVKAMSTPLEKMQLLDAATYLPDDILQKVDRASMTVALETRPPLLDHRVVEFAWSLPRHQKIRGSQSKWILRQVLYRHVPSALIERPKMGFGIPLAEWLRGPLREWAGDHICGIGAGNSLLDSRAVQRLWQEHLSRRRNWAHALWTVVMLESWRRELALKI